MGTPFFLLTLLVVLSRLESTDSKSASFRNDNSIKQQLQGVPIEDECDVRRPDGTCHNQWRVGKKENNGIKKRVKKRQTNCDRFKSLNCRIMMGKKRHLDTSALDDPRCIRSAGGSNLCKKTNYRRLNPDTPCNKRSGKCQELYMYKSAVKGRADLETKNTLRSCDLKSPLCYMPFPGKRQDSQKRERGKEQTSPSAENLSSYAQALDYQQSQREVDHEDSVTVTEKDLLGALLVTRGITMLPYEFNEKEDKEKSAFIPTVAEEDARASPTSRCDPKRNYQCRFRVIGKRSKINRKSRPTNPNSFKAFE